MLSVLRKQIEFEYPWADPSLSIDCVSVCYQANFDVAVNGSGKASERSRWTAALTLIKEKIVAKSNLTMVWRGC